MNNIIYICSMLEIERIEWWIMAEATKLRLKAEREAKDKIMLCEEIKLKNQNNEQDNETNHKD